VAARFLARPRSGSKGAHQYLGVTAVKSRQKDDWSRRPLTAEQEAYALDDVLHSSRCGSACWKPSTDRTGAVGGGGMRRAGRAGGAREAVDADAYMKIKGARELDARGLGVLRELYTARRSALRLDRPPS